MPASPRRDEIGDLSRALSTLTERLRDRIALAESLAADVSHELKNPLASIRSAVELAAGETDGSARGELLASIQRHIVRMERLLDDLREMTGLEAVFAEESPQSVDLRVLVEGTAAAARSRSGPSGIAIQVCVPATEVRILAHPERLVQVMENLIDNAISFSPARGSVEVVLKTVPGAVDLEVRDRGPGIPPELRERVFDRFYSDRPEGNGHSGLGLAIVRAIVEAHGGRISAGPQAGGGTVVHVRLPRR
jgi:two-component system sensor histidine kinase ChvG